LATNLYEAMFVVDSAKGGSECPKIVRHIGEILTRHGAAIERIERWDERKLAYPIKQAKRGVYILVYFRADSSAITEIRTTANLSEELLRMQILRAERQSPVKGQLFTPEGEAISTPPAAPEPAAAKEGPEPAGPEPAPVEGRGEARQ